MRVMVDVLPSPMKGLLVATFAAAYMSTIGTHLNWGASYLVNDFYLRFIRPDASDRARVNASRLATVTLMVLSLVVMALSQECGARLEAADRARRRHRPGVHSPVVLVADQCVVGDQRDGRVVHHLDRIPSGARRLREHLQPGLCHRDAGDDGLSTAVWLTVTMLTPPEDDAVLERFYRRVRPGGMGGAGIGAPGLRIRPDSRGLPGLGELDRRRGRGVFGRFRRWRVPDRQLDHRAGCTAWLQ